MKNFELNEETLPKKIIWNSFSLSEALQLNIPEGIEIYSVSINSRKLESNSLFIGIKGDNFDGSDYAIDALNNGASLCIVDKEISVPTHFKKQIIKVSNTFDALNQLAVYSRNRVKGVIIGLTGSVGKTSTKEMLKIALSQQGEVHSSIGNYNNQLGMPLSLANMSQDTDFGIFEMGMRAQGEISWLSKICRPDVAIITTVNPVHLEFFSSIAAIAGAKSEIFDGMEEEGYAIINYDNPYHQIMVEAATAKKLNIISFACETAANFKLIDYHFKDNVSYIKAEYFGKDIDYIIGCSGKQHAINSLAVLAAVYSAKGEILNAAYQLKNYKPQKGRGEVLIKNNITIIDDSYNASPASVKFAIKNLSIYKNSDSRIMAVLGDMKELGSNEEFYHSELLADILDSSVEIVYTVGELMGKLHEILPQNLKGEHAEDSLKMLEILKRDVRPNDVLLIKGSQSMKMEVILNLI